MLLDLMLIGVALSYERNEAVFDSDNSCFKTVPNHKCFMQTTLDVPAILILLLTFYEISHCGCLQRFIMMKKRR